MREIIRSKRSIFKISLVNINTRTFMLIFSPRHDTQSVSMNIDYRYYYIRTGGKRMHYQKEASRMTAFFALLLKLFLT